MEMSLLVTLMVPSQFGEKVTSYKNSPVHFFTIIEHYEVESSSHMEL